MLDRMIPQMSMSNFRSGRSDSIGRDREAGGKKAIADSRAGGHGASPISRPIPVFSVAADKTAAARP